MLTLSLSWNKHCNTTGNGSMDEEGAMLSISLRNSMKLGKFSECEVVAGYSGIDKIVENITIMEVPDIVKWLKGRELILTSLFAIKNDIDAQNLLIQRLFYAGATAIAIKPFESMEYIPEGIIKSANKLGFPVILIPEHIKYLDIMSPVMHYIFNKKVVLQEDLEQATNVLQEISLNSQGVDVFVENVSTITKNTVTIESEFAFIQTPKAELPISPLSEDEKHELSIIKRPIRYERKYGDHVVPCVVAPIIVDGELYGNVTCWAVNHDHLTMDLAILEKASSLLSLEFLRQKVKYDLEQQYQNDFLRELLFNKTIREQDLIEWGRKYDISNHDRYVCMLLHKENNQDQPTDQTLSKAEINDLLLKKWPTMLTGVIRNTICVIHAVHEHDVKQTCDAIYETLAKKYPHDEIYLGVGEVYEGPFGIRKSFTQAEQSLKLMQTMNGSKRITYFNELGAFRLLGPLLEEQELIDFYDETVGKLIKQDPKGELIHTLQTFFYHNEVLKVTAETLFIHVNTLKYRLNRVEDITGYDLRKSEDKMNIFLGLKIHELIQTE